MHDELAQKEGELSVIKRQLGITPWHELYQGMANSWKMVGGKWKEVQESSASVCMPLKVYARIEVVNHLCARVLNRFQKIDGRLTEWKHKLEESER